MRGEHDPISWVCYEENPECEIPMKFCGVPWEMLITFQETFRWNSRKKLLMGSWQDGGSNYGRWEEFFCNIMAAFCSSRRNTRTKFYGEFVENQIHGGFFFANHLAFNKKLLLGLLQKIH